MPPVTTQHRRAEGARADLEDPVDAGRLAGQATSAHLGARGQDGVLDRECGHDELSNSPRDVLTVVTPPATSAGWCASSVWGGC